MPDDRQVALHEAVALAATGHVGWPLSLSPAAQVVAVADLFYRWLTAPVALTVSFADHAYPQGPGSGPGEPTILKGPNMAQIPDNFQVSLTVAETDTKAQPVTGDSLVWAVADATVAALTPSADGYSALAVAGVPGATSGTVTDSTVDPPLVGNFEITVTSGQAASLIVTEGTPEPQPVTPAP